MPQNSSPSPEAMRLAIACSHGAEAQGAMETLRDAHPWVSAQDAEAFVVLGGDGFMLHVLHQMLDSGRILPAYGLNYGSVGFLMNKTKSSRSIGERVAKSRRIAVAPLKMTAITNGGDTQTFYAINEVSLLRETRQTAKLQVMVNGRKRMAELACDGVLVATPAGSTAYNLSANGPILPLDSNMLALTPISPFRPRRWRGAILPDRANVSFKVLEPKKRPVAVVADQKEVRDVSEVHISIDHEHQLSLLFDRASSLDERIFDEQFQV